ncbi:hypothetical protein [Tellurirhabdus bombi]|uniref:hypothetical protein n=1 Tax=Tellurirhabdus bombi TaxID=2907205 RepID=UPI001F1B7E1C|nr:hypothetical protein [Tellurirhabdus bombi]
METNPNKAPNDAPGVPRGGMHVPLWSWWKSPKSGRLFCIVGISFTSRSVLESGKTEPVERPLAELKKSVEDGLLIPVCERDTRIRGSKSESTSERDAS